MTGPKIEPQYTDDQFVDALKTIFSETPFVTTRMLADEVGCSREIARRRLVSLADDGDLEPVTVGGSVKVYHHPEATDAALDAVDSTGTTEQAPAQDYGKAVGFFPSRREFVVNETDTNIQKTLSKTAHLVDSQEDWYLYKASPDDIWNSPYNTFGALTDDLQSLVGDRWDTGFESRIKNDWDDANTFTLRTHDDGYTILDATSERAIQNVAKRALEYNDHYTQYVDDSTLRIKNGADAEVKEHLYDEGYPVADERRLTEGESLDISLADDISLRDYQQEWVDAFMERKSGTFVGPSGSGKTIAAIGVMEALGGETLIVTPRREIASQWREELLENTTLGPYQVGEYHGGEKNVRPVTITTYDTTAMSRHRDLFDQREWGLVISDECHHAVSTTWKRFRGIQSKARLGLSATPVRESGDAKEIYTLIGPPVGADWGRLFTEGWVSKPVMDIVMVPWGSDNERDAYKQAGGTAKRISAAANSKKVDVVSTLLDRHDDEKVIVFADFIEQGEMLSEELGIPFISGDTPHDSREEFYDSFRDGEHDALILSRVGDEGIDLPDAGVAILTSTMGSSRAQTGQRAGRTMRPGSSSRVYVLLTEGSGEADWGRESTQHLAEKGVNITRVDYDDL